MAFVLIDERALLTAETVLTVAEVASSLRCTRSNVEKLIQRGRLQAVSFKGLLLIPVREVDRLLAERRVAPERYERQAGQARRMLRARRETGSTGQS